MGSVLDDVKNIEKILDDKAEKLPIWSLPIRPVLLGFHFVLYSMLHGKDAKRAAGQAVAGRFSYLLYLMERCAEEPSGNNALDAFQAFMEQDPKFKSLDFLIPYSHFCELMPEVHRGYYAIEKTSEFEYKFCHQSEKFAKSEMRDILVSELSMPYVNGSHTADVGTLNGLASSAPNFDPKVFSKYVAGYMHHYLHNVKEEDILSESAFQTSFGCERQAFKRFRAAIMGFSRFANDMASALQILVKQNPNDKQRENEWLEWVSLFYNKNYIHSMLMELSGLDAKSCELMFTLFGLRGQSSSRSVSPAGDGFFPPFANLKDGIVIGPDLSQMFMSQRNAVYSIGKINKKHFDNIISEHLEPELVSIAAKIFEQQDRYRVVKNLKWEDGEIDLLIVDQLCNTALQVQAKASLAPQGARMTDRTSGRFQEGINQINRFKSLAQEVKDQIISNAIDCKIKNVSINDGLLSRSCFGGIFFRNNDTDIIQMTLPILRLATAETVSIPLPDLVQRIQMCAEDLETKSNAKWEYRKLSIDEYHFTIPLLKYDTNYIDQIRHAANI